MKYDVQAFIILDPFDWTSNYGKPVTLNSPLLKQYLNMFDQIKLFMTTQGIFPPTLCPNLPVAKPPSLDRSRSFTKEV